MSELMESLNDAGQEAADQLSDVQADSWLVQTELLSYGLPTLRLPKNALLTGNHSSDRRLAFIDAESYQTTFAGESLVQKGSSWRAFLERSRVPVAEGRIFRSNERKSMTKYADSLGYPVRLRFVREDRHGRPFAVVTDEAELATSITKLRKRFESGRILVQRHYPGSCVSVLVAGGQTVSALGTDQNGAYLEVGQKTHPEIKRLAVDTVKAVPGIEDASVGILVEDIGAALAGQSAVVDAISASPMLRARERAFEGDADLGPSAQFIRSQASRNGVELQDRANKVRLAFRFSSVVNTGGFRDVLAAEAASLELNFVSEGDEREDDSVQLVLSGTPASLALLAFIAVNRLPSDYRAHLVETEHV